VVDTALRTGEIGMESAMADTLAEFRAFNYDRIYMRPASVEQGKAVVRVLHALVEHYAGSGQPLREAVTYVAGMTDRFAFEQAVAHLGWDPGTLPAGLDVARRP
jgi:dGTPase